MIVIALDPGATTGVALWGVPSEEHLNVTQHPWLDAAGWLHQFLHSLPEEQRQETQVVCESFTITAATVRKSRQMEPLWMIGAARYLSSLYGLPDLVEQSPANAKSFATDVKMRKIEWYRPGLPHGTDAARHLLLWLVNDGRFDIGRFTR